MKGRALVQLEVEYYEKAAYFHEKRLKEYKQKIRANNALIVWSNTNMNICWGKGLQKAQKIISNQKEIEEKNYDLFQNF